MHRAPPSKSYDLLHGLHFPANASSIFALLNYFPPPPPLIPGPPPKRSWTCSAHSLSSSSCFVSDDLNPPSLRVYSPSLTSTPSSSPIKNTSPLPRLVDQNSKTSPFQQFLQSHLTILLLVVIFLCVLAFVILFFVLFLYAQRTRRRRQASNVHLGSDASNSDSNNHHAHNTNKGKNFGYHLLPYREKLTTTFRKSADEAGRARSTNHDAVTVEVTRRTKSSGTHQNGNEEHEEAL